MKKGTAAWAPPRGGQTREFPQIAQRRSQSHDAHTHGSAFLGRSWENTALCPLCSVLSKGMMWYSSKTSELGYVSQSWLWARAVALSKMLNNSSPAFPSGRWELLLEPTISAIFWVPRGLEQLLSLRRPWLGTQSPYRIESATWWFQFVSKIFFFFSLPPGPTNPVNHSSLDLQDWLFPLTPYCCYNVVNICIFLGRGYIAFYKVFSLPSHNPSFYDSK